MENVDIIKHFEDIYKIKFPDDKKKEFIDFLKSSELDKYPITIRIFSDFKAFRNNVTLNIMDDTNGSYHHEMLLYSLYSISPTVERELVSGNRTHVETIGGTMDDLTGQNIAIIGTVDHPSHEEYNKEHFIYIYNKKIDAAGSFIFEDI